MGLQRSGPHSSQRFLRLPRDQHVPGTVFPSDSSHRSYERRRTELRARCRRLHDLKIIAVDDVQQLHYGTRPLGSRYEEVSEIARGLKHLAKELEIPVVAVPTLNRAPGTAHRQAAPDQRPV
ncbi:DnaB-like helicase C-terminal domain-containing protein [Streptomyces collinus]|uniref:DnaB-like helicase C-terminal domain-containing protein n=1 Tax=Streptomyces collinus TaxID=42684 RepID=UPI0033D47E2E